MKKKHQLLLATAVLGATLLLPSWALAADFTDVADNPHQEAIQYVAEQKLFQGVAAGQFAPNETLDRGMAVTVLSRQAKAQGNPDGQFTDVDAKAYYAPAVAWAVESGIVQGVGDSQFAPNQKVTRNQLNAMAQRYLHWLGRSDAPQLLAAGDEPATRGEAAQLLADLDRFLENRSAQVLEHQASDGVTLTGKLDLPATGDIDTLVLFINGSGPNTYDNRRSAGDLDFKYFDLFAEQFGSRNIGFFRWNTRGVRIGTEAPNYDQIDDEIYKTYVPATSVSDIGEWIKELRQNPRLKDAKIYLLGWSEGTIIAPLAAEKFDKEISGLLLAGYCNDRMDEIFDWQQSGASSMLVYNQYFDYDGDGKISKAEFEQDKYQVKTALGLAEAGVFAQLDQNSDGFLTAADLGALQAPMKEAFYQAVEKGDDAWLKANYGVQLTSGWFKAHVQLKPNREVLPTLNLPMQIFHGTADANCSVAGAEAIKADFEKRGKTNLQVHIYQGYDHNLGYNSYPVTGYLPQPFVDLFQALVTPVK